MRFLIKAILVLGLAVGVVSLLGKGPGYVQIQVGSWVLETTFSLAVIGILILLVLGWEAWALLSATWRAPKWVAEKRAQRQQRRSLERLQDGLLALERGEMKQAQRLLARGGDRSKTSAAFYLEAARAAHQGGQPVQAEAYLDRIQEQEETIDPAVSLLRAEIEKDTGRREQALASLADLEKEEGENPRVLKRLLQLYRELEEYEAVLRLLPRSRKARVIDTEEAEQLGRIARGRALEEAYQKGEGDRVEQLWKEASYRERADPRLVVPWVRYLLEQGRGEEAQKALEQALRRNWQGPLLGLFLALPEASESTQLLLERLEGWLEDHPRDPHLLIVLGQLAIRAECWEKADQYLEEAASLEGLPPELLIRIAHLCRERGRSEEALAYCQRAFAALEGQGERALPPPTAYLGE